METTGNFLTQPNKDFPLDCETLDMLQSNAALAAALGSVAGDKLIVDGCDASAGGGIRSAGLVFLKTKQHPEGEVMRWEGGDTTGGMHVKTEDIAVSAMGVEYPKAYTRRTLAAGVGTENYRWEEFTRPKTPGELEAQIAELKEKLAESELKAQGEPAGVVKMWAGLKVPEGYALCDGAALRVSEYPALYAAIGDAFNTAVNYNGSQNTTQSGFFRLPDLRGRFIVGYSDVDKDYNSYGKSGGEKKHTLTEGELAEHTHEQVWRQAWFRDSISGGNWEHDYVTGGENAIGKRSTGTAGGGEAHENRPPYYTLAYIIKVG